MAQLLVRGLAAEVVRRLKERAAANGRSAEEEHRQLLQRSLLSGGFAERLAEIPDVGDDEDFARPRELPRDVPL